MLNIKAKLLTRGWQETGEEDVAIAYQVVEHFTAFVAGQIQSDRSLAAVVMLEHPVGFTRLNAAASEETHWVWSLGIFDVNHISTPLGQNRASSWAKGPHGQIKNANAVEHAHGSPIRVR